MVHVAVLSFAAIMLPACVMGQLSFQGGFSADPTSTDTSNECSNTQVYVNPLTGIDSCAAASVIPTYQVVTEKVNSTGMCAVSVTYCAISGSDFSVTPAGSCSGQYSIAFPIYKYVAATPPVLTSYNNPVCFTITPGVTVGGGFFSRCRDTTCNAPWSNAPQYTIAQAQLYPNVPANVSLPDFLVPNPATGTFGCLPGYTAFPALDAVSSGTSTCAATQCLYTIFQCILTSAAAVVPTSPLQGPTGPAGPAGIPSPYDGLPGLPGSNGPQGPTGNTGASGPQGVAGQQGTNGAPGSNGLPGGAGPDGAKGAQGGVGLPGPQGVEGQGGAPGPKGAKGAQGVTGVQGPVGPQGDAGDNGANGAPGANGPAGPTGATGPAGAAGENGDNGEPGDVGPIGVQGPAGPQGPAGATGRTGHTGHQGPTRRGGAGAKGARGAPGELTPRLVKNVVKKVLNDILDESDSRSDVRM